MHDNLLTVTCDGHSGVPARSLCRRHGAVNRRDGRAGRRVGRHARQPGQAAGVDQFVLAATGQWGWRPAWNAATSASLAG
ncbi:MAG TPA: hypothetical protein VIP10_05670, partial [Burkholderiaceae bacterium]